MNHEKVAVLDFGGQYAHLIANRIRRLSVYSEIVDNDTPADQLKSYKGIILSGGPNSVYEEGAPHCDKAIFDLGIPILGICYGHQVTQYLLGGTVTPSETKEYGMAKLNIVEPVGILKNVKQDSRVWMSHGDSVDQFAPGFRSIGTTSDCHSAALFDEARQIYGTQFHLEVTHTEEGMKMFDNFLELCGVKRDWNIEQFMKEEMEAIQKKIGDKKVFLLVSGGVDSSVCFALLEKALGKGRVFGLLVDHGLMRLDEAEKVKKALSEAGFNNLHVVNKSDTFFKALAGVSNPERKREIIGELFWNIKEEVAEELKLNPDEWIMGQGTIYPDTIETGGSKHADKIKTHHNRVDLVQQMINEGRVIEPLAQLYKDEVRVLGEKLGLPHAMVWRQPFPGPGLGVRILCVDEREASATFSKAFEKTNAEISSFIREQFKLDDVVAQILPIKSVGVQGDVRTYRHPLALFTSLRDWDQLEEISTAVTNRFTDVNRVILALRGGAGTFELKASDISAERVNVLQKADEIVCRAMEKAPEDYGIWQFPVVLAPTSTESGKESIILRPIVSTEAMTASFARIDRAVADQMAERLRSDCGAMVTHVFYDLTHKPPGTIEWE